MQSKNSKKPQQINEIDSSKLNALDLAAADCQFLIDQKLHFVKNNVLFVFNLQDLSLQNIQLNSEDQVVPAETGEIYLLRKITNPDDRLPPA